MGKEREVLDFCINDMPTGQRPTSNVEKPPRTRSTSGENAEWPEKVMAGHRETRMFLQTLVDFKGQFHAEQISLLNPSMYNSAYPLRRVKYDLVLFDPKR